MFRYFLNAFKITNDNIILTTPLVLFLLLFSIYLGVAKSAPSNLASSVLLLVTTLFMLSAFFAGWLFMVKKAVDLSKAEFIIDEDRAKASFALLREIPIGVGEYFFSFIGALVLYTAFFFLTIFAVYQIGIHLIGNAGVNFVQLKIAMTSPVAMKALILSMNKEQLIKLNEWNILIIIFMSIFSFITMFWPVQIIFKNKNAFFAFFNSLKFLFKNFLGSVTLFIYLSLINFFISMVNAFAAINPIVYFFSMLLYFYFIVYIVVLVFLYYDSEQNKKLTQEAPSNSDSGPDGIGQEQSGDSEGEGD